MIYREEKRLTIRYLMLIVHFLFISVMMHAQKNLGEAKVDCPDTVSVGSKFLYEVSIPVDETFQEIVCPPFEKVNVNIVSGPSRSISTSYSLENGKERTTFSRTYRYRLEAKSRKSIIIPSYIIKSKSSGDYFSVPEKTIVCKRRYTPSKTSNMKSSEQGAGNKKDTLFLYTTVDRTDICIEDSVLVTTRLYTTKSVSNLQARLKKLPDNCFCQPIKLDSLTLVSDTFDGLACSSCLIESYWLYPCKTGIVEIPSNNYLINLIVENTSVDPFEAFFNGNLTLNETVVRNTNSVKIDVKPSVIRQNTFAERREERKGIIYALDISASMGNIFDFSSSRLELAKKMIRKSCGESATIIPFAGNKEPSIVYPLMSDVLDTIVRPNNDGTALYDLCMSVAMDTTNYCRDLIVFTDGNDNSSHVSLQTVTKVMKERGVRVNIVSINSERDSVFYKHPDPEASFMIENKIPQKFDLVYLAQETGGLWMSCKNEKKMGKIIKKVISIPKRPYKRTDLQRIDMDYYNRLKRNYLKNPIGR